MLDLAIIIPTYREERYIGKLLDSLATQIATPKEIMVVDVSEEKTTIEQVLKRKHLLPNLFIETCPLSTISRQRNLGVEKTTAGNILFLDADTIFPTTVTLGTYFEETQMRNLTMAACENIASSTNVLDKAYFKSMHRLFKVSQKLWPVVIGTNLFVTRKFFLEVGGFDEKVKVGEDIEFFQRALRTPGCAFGFLQKAKIFVSVRRIKKEGRIRFGAKMIKSFWNVKRYGFSDNPISYEFGSFPQEA